LYKGLCNLILSTDSLTTWIRSASPFASNPNIEIVYDSESSTTELDVGGQDEDMPIRDHKSVKKSMQILEIEGWIQDTAVLASSLISSIREQRDQSVDLDQFITLAHHPSVAFPMAKVQLMVSISRQLLLNHAESFHEVRPQFKDLQEALQTNNTAYKEASVWRLLRTLLGSRRPGQTFVLIHQPDDEKLSHPFLELTSNLSSLVMESEISCKVLVIRKAPLSAPLPGQRDILSRSNIGDEHSVARIALQTDYEAEFNQIIRGDPRLSALQEDVAKLLGHPSACLVTAGQCFAVVERNPLSFLRWSSTALDSSCCQHVIDLILDMVPEPAQPWVKAGLVWITHAVRPLTYTEFATVATNGSEANSDHNKTSIVVEEFQRLLCGLVEIDGNTIYLVSSDVAELLTARLMGQEKRTKHKNDQEKTEDTKNRTALKWYSSVSHPHFDISRRCIELLRAHLEDKGEQATKPLDRGPEAPINTSIADTDAATAKLNEPTKEGKMAAAPLLSYAAEHWLSHIQLWNIHLEGSTKASPPLLPLQESETPGFVIQFLEDESLTNRWLELRNPRHERGIQRTSQYNIPRIAATLGLDMKKCTDLAAAVSIVQLASATQTGRAESAFSSLAIALSQLGHVEALAKLDTEFFEQESTLETAFRTGSDAALCYLASRYPDFVRLNRNTILSNAIRLGNVELMHTFADEKDAGYSPNDFTPPLFHITAELTSLSPPESFWARFKSHVGSVFNGRTAVHLAALSGHSDMVPRLLAEGLEVNHQDSSGATPLLLAARQGNFTVASQLLTAQANPSVSDKGYHTPLHAASANGYLDIVRLLLRHGAKIDAKNGRRNTPLHLALENNHADIALVLLQECSHSKNIANRYQHRASTHSERRVEISAHATGHDLAAAAFSNQRTADEDLEGERGSSAPKVVHHSSAVVNSSSETVITTTETKIPKLFRVDSQNAAGLTPLSLAIKGNHVRVVKDLVSHGANVSITDREGMAPLHYAATVETSEIIDQLLEVPGIDVNVRDRNGITPLHLASSRGHVAIIKKLVERDADCNVMGKVDNLYPLELACERGQTGAAEVMVSFCRRNTLTAGFLKAASAGYVDTAELLLHAGADENASTTSGKTALHYGAFNSNTRLVQMLLVRKPALNPVDSLGRTPLHDAAMRNSVDCLKMLVDAGADVNVPDGNSVTALFTAAMEDNQRCVAILLAAKATLRIPPAFSQVGTTFLEVALAKFKPDVFRMILERVSSEGGRWDLSDNSLLLLLREGEGSLEKLRFLLGKGLKHDRIIGDYGTMLHYAALWDNLNLVKILSRKGRAKPGIVHGEHGTPLQIAAEKAMKNSLEVVRALLHAGADATLGSGKSGTPLHGAARMPGHNGDEYLEIARAIVERDPRTLHIEAGIYPTVLQAAVAGGTIAMVRLILNKGPKLNVVAGTFGTPLHLAARYSYEMERDLLLNQGSPHLNRETVDIEGRLPLHMTSRAPFLSSMLVLRSEEFGPTTTDYQKRHMFHFCAGRGNMNTLDWMLKHHPEAKFDKDIDGWTPLHWACRQDSIAVVTLLIDKGADKNAKTDRGWRPIDVAKYHGKLLDRPRKANVLLQVDDEDDPTRDSEDSSTDKEETLPAKFAGQSTSANDDVTYVCDSCQCVSILTAAT
jgi:ankyrin repeat protein